MKGAIEVKTKSFNAALDRYAEGTGRKMGDVIKRACVFLAKAYMVSTQPRDMANGDGNFRKNKGEVIYNGKGDHALGKNAALRDVGRVFGSFQQATNEIKNQSKDAAKGFAKAIKDGNMQEAERIAQSVGIQGGQADVGKLDPRIHQASRNEGRVKRKNIARFVDKKELDAYKKKVTAMVGFAKSAWLHAGRRFGAMTNTPAFIKRHDAPMKVVDHTSKATPGASMTSMVKYASKILSRSRQAEAQKYAEQRMMTMMNVELELAAKKAKLKAEAKS